MIMLSTVFFRLAKEPSLIEELWEYFVDKYFSVDLPYLENFTIETGGLISLQGIIIGITVGLIIASAGTIYNKRYIGSFVRRVISCGCFDAKSAKTLYDLGYLKSPGIRGVIKSGGSLSRWVRCAEEDEFLVEVEKKRAEFEEAHKNDEKKPKFIEPEFKRDLNTMHFYIPEEKKYAAEIRFEDKGANVGAFILVVLLSLAICALVCYFLPDLIKMVDNFISVVKG